MKKEILKIAYKYILLLLVAALMCTGTVFARYTSSYDTSLSAGIAGFNYSYTVDEVSATQFSNVKYYFEDAESDTGYSKSVGAGSNYITYTIDGSTSDVDAQSTFTFSTDFEFLYNLAFQVTELKTNSTSGTTTETAITPQYVVSEILRGNNNAATHGQYYSVTGDSGYLDYGEVSGYDTSYNSLDITASTSSTFTAKATDSSGTAFFTLATSSSAHEVTYIFDRGLLRDTNGGIVTTGGTNDRSGTEVYVETAVTSNTSSLTISLPELCIAAGETRTFRFYFTKVEATSYTSVEYSNYYDSYDSVVSSAGVQQRYYNVEYVPCCTSGGTSNGNTATIKVVNDYTTGSLVTSYYYVDSSSNEYELTNTLGTIYGNAEEGIYINTNSVTLTALQNYYNSTYNWSVTDYAVGAEYGMTFDVTFEQASELPE